MAAVNQAHQPHAPRASKQRLDDLLVGRGLAETRERAQALVAAGLIEVDGGAATSAAALITAASEVRVVGKDHPWASRAGLKLAAALDHFGVDVRERVALDAGASTGGFVSVLIERGARRVYAVDVGHGQLIADVANDPRVVVMDRTNLRHLTELPGESPSVVTLDLSFISLRAVMPAVARLAPGAEVVALFKPQFELPRDAVGKGGVVTDGARVRAEIDAFVAWAGGEYAATFHAEPLASPVRGAKSGNQEWLLHFTLGDGV